MGDNDTKKRGGAVASPLREQRRLRQVVAELEARHHILSENEGGLIFERENGTNEPTVA